MRSLSRGDRQAKSIDMNIAFALSDDVVGSLDHYGDHFQLDVALEFDRSSITIRSPREGVLVCAEKDGAVYEAFPLAIREAFYKWQDYKRGR